MSVLREEDSHHTWLTSYIAIGCNAWNLGNILLGIILYIRQQVALGIAKGLCCCNGNLDIYHLIVSLNYSLIGCFTLSHLNVHKEIFSHNLMFSNFQFVQVVLSQELHYFSEQRIHRLVHFQIFNFVDNHNAFVLIELYFL